MPGTKKPNSGNALIASVTNSLIEQIEAGAGKWDMPWQMMGSTDMPKSIDGRYYRGLNVLILHFTALDKGYQSGVWGTYKAWEKHGGQVRKGEKSTEVILWKPYVKKEVKEDGTERNTGGLMVKTFRVFNAEQQDGWVIPPVEPRNSPERISHCEEFFSAIGADVRYGGNHASYNKLGDWINCPNIEQFDSVPHFYSTLAHEHVHWTGHHTRLCREFGQRFGDDAYGAEELVAELGAAILSAKLGIDVATRQDHAAYLSSWLRVLKQDARSLVTVMSKAQAAIDCLEEAAGLKGAEDEAQEDEAGKAVVAVA